MSTITIDMAGVWKLELSASQGKWTAYAFSGRRGGLVLGSAFRCETPQQAAADAIEAMHAKVATDDARHEAAAAEFGPYFGRAA